ncbi:MAG TPA: LD-carboxypeptidase [Bacteroidales bacterium]|nr:LD-carboxypeptidase [Bacteroidales bacterium]
MANIPPYLKQGDTIAIVATARFVTPGQIESSVNLLKEAGFNVEVGKAVFNANNQLAGTDKERADDLQHFINDDKVKAIFCARGGYGTIRTIQQVNFSKLSTNPKWIIGYSDVTVLHSILSNMNIASLHSPMLYKNPDFETSNILNEEVISILKGKKTEYHFNAHPLNFQGRAQGKLVGGNLSVLYSLRGTPYDLQTSDCILFIEDVDEYLYHIDRMMMNLKSSKMLSKLRGIIVGDMTDMHDNQIPFGKNAYEIIAEHVEDLCIPVCYGFPAGHGQVNKPLVLGHKVKLDIGAKCSLTMTGR